MWPANSMIDPVQNPASLFCWIARNIGREADNITDPKNAAAPGLKT
jgi:hypothetical protein